MCSSPVTERQPALGRLTHDEMGIQRETLMIGKTVSHYRILEKLGEGGMGIVYRAEDTKLKRTVALKFLPPTLIRDAEAKERFVREAQAASALDHPNICTIYEVDEVDGQTFIAMACVEGESLKDRMRAGPLRLNEAIAVTIQVAEGLREAHEKGIVHRDIKSANIMVTPNGQARIMDFGLAKLATGETKLTSIGSTMGTLAYMSPEQVRGEDVDRRTDIWSLGVVLYEIVTGRLPFSGEYEPAIMYSILNENPKPVSVLRDEVPIALDSIVETALAKNPDDRYQSMVDLLADLRALSEGRTVGVAGQLVAQARIDKKSIAVLPFKSLSEHKEDEYFSDGTTEDIITQLSKIAELKVISRTSVMRYKHSDKTLREIGRELDVNTILEGSVRRAGNRVRIVSQLVDARTDEPIWAETYDREMKDIFAIQSDVAQSIAAALKAKLSPEVKERIERKPTENLEAYDYYLKGREYYYRYRRQDNENAIELFKRALELDPNYALAYAGLGDAYSQRTGRFGLEATWLDSAIEASEKAISIDAGCAEAHKSLGLAFMAKGWRRKALEAYRKSVQLNPNYYPAVGNIGTTHLALGEYGEALKWARKGLALNPTFAFSYSNVGYAYMCLDNHAEAERWFHKALELQPDFIYPHREFVYMYLARGDFDKARAHSKKALSLAPDEVETLIWAGDVEFYSGNLVEARQYYEKALELCSKDLRGVTCIAVMTCLGCICWKTGKQDDTGKFLGEAAVLAEALLKEGDESRQVPYYVAAINAVRGNKEDAYAWLERAIDAGWRDYRLGSLDPLMENLRNDERFKLMMATTKGMIDQMRKRAEAEQ
ncbi:MAG: protein kinase [Candidatus Eisenbacteria bacterium]|nr:protein kinase [Candidatus Eisenbacteria bacterium]